MQLSIICSFDEVKAKARVGTSGLPAMIPTVMVGALPTVVSGTPHPVALQHASAIRSPLPGSARS